MKIPCKSDVVRDLVINAPSDPLAMKYVRFSKSANPNPAKILMMMTSLLKTVV